MRHGKKHNSKVGPGGRSLRHVRQDTPSEETTRSDSPGGSWIEILDHPVMSLEGERGVSVSRPPGPGLVETGLETHLSRLYA
jgi:hypothetical protein